MKNRALMKAFYEGMDDGMEKTAGGLQSLGRAILKMRSIKTAGTMSGMATKRLAALETQLAGKIGAGGMAKFNKHGVKALTGSGAAGGKGGRRIAGARLTRAAGPQTPVRAQQSAAAAGAQKLRPVANARTGKVTQKAAKQQRTAFRQSEGMATGAGIQRAKTNPYGYQQRLAARPRAQLPGRPTAVTTTRVGGNAPVRTYARGPAYRAPMRQGMMAGFMSKARKVAQHPYAVPAAIGAGGGLVAGAALS